MLAIKDLDKAYRDRSGNLVPVLRQLCLEIAAGEFVCLLGPSGCGKTTTLRIVAGLIPYDGGQVVVNGQSVRGPGEDRSVVFQDYGLLPWRTVQGNVELALEIRGISKKERRARTVQEIQKIGLAGFESHYPHEISGGMQQRVGVARALTKSPSILLMDEPFAAVDMQTREYLQDELLAIWRQIETTVMFITHSIDEAVYLSDRVLVMNRGQIVLEQDIDLPRPRSADVTKSTPRFSALVHKIRSNLGSESLTGAEAS